MFYDKDSTDLKRTSLSATKNEPLGLDSFVLLTLSTNGRKISLSSAGALGIGSRPSLSSKKSKRKSSKSKSKKHKRKSKAEPSQETPPLPARAKRTVLRRRIDRRLTRGVLPTDKRSRRSLDRLEYLFKDAIEAHEAAVEVDLKEERRKEDDSDSLPWTMAKSTEQVLKLIDRNAEAIQANSCGITSEAMERICSQIEKDDKVKKLSLAGNRIGDIGVLALKELIDVTHSLKYIHLWGNNLGDIGADTVAEALKDNKTVNYLILSKNAISEIGAESLCDALTYNKTLTFLDLGENCISDDGAAFFANLLKTSNQTLQHLDLSDNGISIVGAKLLARALKFNTSVEELTLAFNEVTEEKTNQQLQSIGWTMFSQ